MRLLALVASAAALAACGTSETTADVQTPDPRPTPDANLGPSVQTADPMEVQPAGPPPDWAPTIDPQMLAVVEQFLASEPPTPAVRLTPFQFRNAVLPAEAAAAVLMKTGLPPSEPATDVEHRLVPVGGSDSVLVRMYTPLDAGAGPLPVVVYYHGGGWVIADLDTYEPSARALAERTGAIVVSVAYRQAPEHPYPTAHEDSYAAYEWATENAASFGGDPGRVATAGESAGGNLAVAVALMARERGAPLPAHVVAVYPVADGDVESPSYDEYAGAYPLNRPLMEWFFRYYTPDWRTESYEYVDLTSRDYAGFPPTTVVNAEIDPLAHEGGELAERMAAAGVDAERRVYPGVTHEFFGMHPLLEQAVAAQEFAAGRLRASFGT
jgi:acetyl esterase/lipase